MKKGDEVDVTFSGTHASRAAWVEEVSEGWVTIEFNDPRGPFRVEAPQDWFGKTRTRWTVTL
jgi:hypothetical protein